MSEQEPDPQRTPMELIGPLLPLHEKGRGAKGQVPGLNSNLLVNSESSIDTHDDPSDFNSSSAQHIENKTSSSSHNKHLKSSVSINLILVSLCSRQSLYF